MDFRPLLRELIAAETFADACEALDALRAAGFADPVRITPMDGDAPIVEIGSHEPETEVSTRQRPAWVFDDEHRG